MKVTFLTPPELHYSQPAERTAGCTRVVYDMPNIYALTVAAVAQRQGCEVAWEDFATKSPDTLQALEQWLQSDASAMYCLWTVNLSLGSDLQAVELLRRVRPQALVVLMGPGATYFTAKCLEGLTMSTSDEAIAGVVVVRGEPEATFEELIRCQQKGESWTDIKGISYLGPDGKVVNNPARELIADLDALPMPARELLGRRQYHNPKLKTGPYTTMFTSRNCPFHCIYCVPSSLTFAREIEYRRDHGRKPPIAFRSPQSVAAELEMLHSQGYRAIGFTDDNFIWNEKRTAALCEPLRHLGFVWGCQARVDAITEPIAQMLGQSGCRYIDLGIESFDDRILEFIHKGITSSQIYTAIELLKKYGVPVKLNILIGSSPLETKETIRHTLHEAKRLKVDQVMVNIVSPFPGTEFYQMCKDNGWMVTGEYVPTDVQRESILNYPHLSAKQMTRLLRRSNWGYFLRPAYIWRQLRQFRSLAELRSALRAVRIKLFGSGR